MKIPEIQVPNIKDASAVKALLKTLGKQVTVDKVNWKEFPYKPEVQATLGATSSSLMILFEVNEAHVHVATLENNGPVWEDSCVEVFIADPDGQHYYNFEVNAAGVMLASRRTGRNDASHFTESQLGQILCLSSRPKEICDLRGNDVEPWSILLVIPWNLVGCDNGLDEPLRLNLYKCGDATDQPHFLSLFPISTDNPDFHRPEFFGEVEFEK